VAQTGEVDSELDFQVLTGNTIRDTQSSILKLVGMDYRTFINSAFLLQGRSDEFTNSTPALRQRTLGEILQLDYFDKLQELAREKVRELRSDKTTVELQVNTLQDQLARFTEEEMELKVLSSDLIQVDQHILEIQPLLENRKQDYLLIEEIETKTSKLLIDKKTLVDDLSIFNNQLSTLQRKISEYQDILDKKEVIHENFQEINRLRNKLQQNNNLIGPYSSLIERKKSLENALVRLNEIIEQLETLKQNLFSTQKLLDELQNKKEQLNLLQLQIQEKNTHNDNLKNQMDDLKEKILLIEDSDQNCPLCGTELLNDRREHVKEEFEKNGKTLADAYRSNITIISELETKKLSILDYINQNDSNINNEFIRINSQIAAYTQEKNSLDQSETQLSEINKNIEDLGFDPVENKILEEKLIQIHSYEDLFNQLSLAEKEIPEIENRISDIQKLILSRNTNIEKIDHELNDYDIKKKSAPEIKSEVEKLQNDFDNLLNQKIEKNSRKLSIERQFEVYSSQKTELNQYENQLLEINSEYGRYDELSTYLGRTGVQALLIEASIPEIEKDANYLLEKMTNGEMFINLETQRQTQKGDTAETLEINVSDSRGMRSYETFSGGEAFRINLALRIALSKLLARRSGCPLPTIFIDEGFGTQDNVGRERIIEVINQISSDFERVVVITHIEEIKEAFPVRIEVIKTESGSMFELN